MTLNHQFSFSPASAVQASNSGTVTLDFIAPSPKCSNAIVGALSFGNLSASGTLALEVYTGIESSVAASAAWQYLGVTSLNASSTSGLAFTSLTNAQILPYVRAKVLCKAGGAPATIFENIVAKLALS